MFTEDLTAFFQDADFAVVARYNGATAVMGIFDSPDLAQLGVLAGSNPTFTCAAADIDEDPTGDALVIDGVSYTIRDIQPQDDGTVVVLQLSAV